ncbi:hypothetical protein, partial [Sinorhizobium meliloti]|uniref:hypothetical protein n=1 Tax=Rhizobium meliloti TaxID=382 RepID=UPI001AECB919
TVHRSWQVRLLNVFHGGLHFGRWRQCRFPRARSQFPRACCKGQKRAAEALERFFAPARDCGHQNEVIANSKDRAQTFGIFKPVVESACAKEKNP